MVKILYIIVCIKYVIRYIYRLIILLIIKILNSKPNNLYLLNKLFVKIY